MASSATTPLQIDRDGAWVRGIEHCLSPNHDQRPAGQSVDLIVIHAISLPPDQFGGPYVDQLFCNQLDPDADPYFAQICTLRVSAHVLIRRDGELTQYVPFTHRAWHAGESCFANRTACNDFSIGIEMEGCDTLPFKAIQYRQLARLVKSINQAWPGTLNNPLQGHSDIAPGRKTDPGPCFDWHQLQSELNLLGTPVSSVGSR